MTPSPSERKQARRRRLEIERDGAKVRFTVECGDIYDAMQLYDEAVAGAAAGDLDLTVVTKTARDAGEQK